VRARLEAAFGPLREARDPQAIPGVGPARHLEVAGGAHEGAPIGIISAVSEPFCETCNRVRLSAIGRLHTCLARDEELDLRGPLRAGAADAELVALVRGALAEKAEGHAFSPCGAGAPKKHMVAIGG
jgi:cyclic pyranopterin phosphate synthase